MSCYGRPTRIDENVPAAAFEHPHPGTLARHRQHRRPLPRGIAYIDAHLSEGDTLPLMRLRYGGSAHRWGFALYLASKDGYQDQILPTGHTAGTPEEALDCAAGLYLDNP